MEKIEESTYIFTPYSHLTYDKDNCGATIKVVFSTKLTEPIICPYLDPYITKKQTNENKNPNNSRWIAHVDVKFKQ